MSNKKTRIILIVLSSLLVVFVAATIVLWPYMWNNTDLDAVPGTIVFGTDSDKLNGYADVNLYGAVPNDNKDDTDAFIKAAETGAGIYVPLGVYDIDKTVVLRGQNLKGAGIDRTTIRFNGNGIIVEMKKSSIINDITLSFAKDCITGKETEGEQVAIKDCGITNGAALRSVKVSNVGTGYYSDVTPDINFSFSTEVFLIDEFSYKAIEIKDINSSSFRGVNVGKTIGSVDSAISIGGTFTFDSIVFSKTKCNYPLELVNSKSAVINNVVFEDVQTGSGSLIKSISSVLSIITATAVNSKADTLIKIEDIQDNGATMGNVISLWSNSGIQNIDENNVIKYENIVFE